jgi:hypothetical protein
MDRCMALDAQPDANSDEPMERLLAFLKEEGVDRGRITPDDFESFVSILRGDEMSGVDGDELVQKARRMLKRAAQKSRGVSEDEDDEDEGGSDLERFLKRKLDPEDVEELIEILDREKSRNGDDAEDEEFDADKFAEPEAVSEDGIASPAIAKIPGVPRIKTLAAGRSLGMDSRQERRLLKLFPNLRHVDTSPSGGFAVDGAGSARSPSPYPADYSGMSSADEARFQKLFPNVAKVRP